MRRCVWEGVWLRLVQDEREGAMGGTSDGQIESLEAPTKVEKMKNLRDPVKGDGLDPQGYVGARPTLMSL